jgi:hypothetical protein
MISILTLILINVIWITYSMSEGIREGYFTHFEELRRRKCKTDINKLFKFQRLLVLLSLTGVAFWIFGPLQSLFVFIGLFLTFSYLHNGVYNCTRCKLDEENYKLGFKDGITKRFFSTFRSYKERSIFFISGIALQIFLYIFLI